MTALSFVDSNVLIYAHAVNEPRKRDIAAELLRQLWRDRNGRVSMQVLSETYYSLTRKAVPRMEHSRAWREVEALLAWSPQVIDRPLLERAHQIEERHKISWWDAQIIAAAEAQHCPLLLSEDLQDGAVYGRVTVRNPFNGGVQEALAGYAITESPRPRHRPRGRPPGSRRAAVL